MSTVGCFEGLSCVWGVEIGVVGVMMIVNKGSFLRQNNWNAQDHSYLRHYQVLINCQR